MAISSAGLYANLVGKTMLDWPEQKKTSPPVVCGVVRTGILRNRGASLAVYIKFNSGASFALI